MVWYVKWVKMMEWCVGFWILGVFWSWGWLNFYLSRDCVELELMNCYNFSVCVVMNDMCCFVE